MLLSENFYYSVTSALKIPKCIQLLSDLPVKSHTYSFDTICSGKRRTSEPRIIFSKSVPKSDNFEPEIINLLKIM